MQMGKKYIDLGASREVRRRVVQSGTAVQHKRVFFRAQDVAAGRAAKPQELGTGHRVTSPAAQNVKFIFRHLINFSFQYTRRV